MTNPTGDAESLEAEFVKQFGPMEIHTGYGRDIEIYKLDQQEKLAAFKAGAAFITRSLQPVNKTDTSAGLEEKPLDGVVSGSFDCGFCNGRHELVRELEYLRSEGSVTVPRLQRRFRFGFHHALSVFQAMQTRGFISPSGVSLLRPSAQPTKPEEGTSGDCGAATSLPRADYPAFPTVCQDLSKYQIFYLGITIRDYFAAQAMMGMQARDDYDEGQATPEQRANLAYIEADAMIARREQSPESTP